MNLAKVSANGQVTVPVEIRRKLNLKKIVINAQKAFGDYARYG